MSIWIELKCNSCNKTYGQPEYYTRENIAKLKAAAKADGWIVTYKGNVICSECQKKLGIDANSSSQYK